MKYFKNWMLVTLIFSLVLIGPMLITGSLSVRAQNEGQWVLKSTDIEIAEEPEGHTYNVGEGSASTHQVSEISGDVFAASGSWTTPKSSYQGEETITLMLTASVDQYVWNGKDDGYIHDGFNYMSFWTAARLDKPDLGWQYATGSQIQLFDNEDNRQPKVQTDNGEITVSSQQFTVSAVFPTGHRDGDERTLYVTSPVGQNRYNYVWQAGPGPDSTTQSQTAPVTETESEQRQILLHGGLHNIASMPMRNLSLIIDAFFHSETETIAEASPSWSNKTISDARGGHFKARIPLPEEAPDRVTIRITGQFHCLLPNGSLIFYMTDFEENSSEDEITFTTTIKLDLNSPEYKDQEQIRVNRLLNFRNLSLNYLSMDVDGWQPDAFESNLEDLEALAAFSYHYVWTWRAQYVGALLFGEIDALQKHPLRLEMRWQPPDDDYPVGGSHYVPINQNIIRLQKEHSRFDDISRFTLLHEYGHHLDAATVDGWHLRTIRAREENTDHTPHGGYMNSTTSDSMMEGFATAFAAMVQSVDSRHPMPHVAGSYDIGQAGNYVAWQHMGLDEELAVSTLLYQTFLQYEAPRSFWQLLKPDYSEFIYYYQAFENNLADRPEALAVLENAARLGGLYQMPFGNSMYDSGEPYRDLNGNGQYDAGEPFGDLMFDVGEDGYIDPEQPLQEWDGEFDLGKSSDAGRDRQTVYQLPGSYVRLTGQTVSEVLVKISPDNEPATQILRAVETDATGQKVYIGLISRPLTGKVDILLPGGPVVYTGDLAKLQRLRRDNAVMDVPLAVVNIEAGALAAALKGAPVYGDPDASGVFEPLSDSQLANYVADVAEQADQADPTATFEAAFNYVPAAVDQTSQVGLEPDQSQGSDHRWMMVLLGLFIVLLLAAVILVVILRNHKQPAASTAYPAYHQDSETPAAGNDPSSQAAGSGSPSNGNQSAARSHSRQYCGQCGTQIETGSSFCGSCGAPF